MSLYSKSEDVNLLKQTRIHKSTAIHDVAAYLHVRDRREGNIRLFQKLNIGLLQLTRSWLISIFHVRQMGLLMKLLCLKN